MLPSVATNISTSGTSPPKQSIFNPRYFIFTLPATCTSIQAQSNSSYILSRWTKAATSFSASRRSNLQNAAGLFRHLRFGLVSRTMGLSYSKARHWRYPGPTYPVCPSCPRLLRRRSRQLTPWSSEVLFASRPPKTHRPRSHGLPLFQAMEQRRSAAVRLSWTVRSR